MIVFQYTLGIIILNYMSQFFRSNAPNRIILILSLLLLYQLREAKKMGVLKRPILKLKDFI